MAAEKIKEGINDTDFKGCHIKIGGFKQKLLCDEYFVDDERNKCEFWQYVPLIKARNNLIHLCIYTEKKLVLKWLLIQMLKTIVKKFCPTVNIAKIYQKKSSWFYEEERTPKHLRFSFLKDQFPCYEDEHSNLNSQEKVLFGMKSGNYNQSTNNSKLNQIEE